MKAAFVKANWWDIAAGMAICKALGMGLYDYDSREKLQEFNETFFHANCRLKKMQICGFAEDFEKVKAVSAGVIND